MDSMNEYASNGGWSKAANVSEGFVEVMKKDLIEEKNAVWHSWCQGKFTEWHGGQYKSKDGKGVVSLWSGREQKWEETRVQKGRWTLLELSNTVKHDTLWYIIHPISLQ